VATTIGGSVTAPYEVERLLTPAEVAQLFRVHPKTVSRWVQSGKISAVRTLGGHRRYRASEVYALLEETGIATVEPLAP
jgi:excisionase family DNA binding protein